MSHTLIQWDREDKIGRIKVRKLVGVDKAGLIVKPKAAHTSKVKQGIQSLFLSHGQVAVQPSPGKQGSSRDNVTWGGKFHQSERPSFFLPPSSFLC